MEIVKFLTSLEILGHNAETA